MNRKKSNLLQKVGNGFKVQFYLKDGNVEEQCLKNLKIRRFFIRISVVIVYTVKKATVYAIILLSNYKSEVRMLKLIKRICCLSMFISVFVIVSTGYPSERKLRVVGESFPPFEFVKDGKVVGIDIDIAKHIFSKMNIPVEFQIQPWKRAWSNVEKGKVDAVLTTSRKAYRKAFVWFPKEDMWKSEFVFFVNKKNVKAGFSGYKSAVRQKSKIGIISGNSYHSNFWEAFPYKDGSTRFQEKFSKTQLNAQLESISKAELNLKKLGKNRIDLTIMDKIVGTYSAKLLGLQNQITYYDHTLFSKGYPMPFVKNSSYPNLKEIAKQFEQELKKLKKTKKYQAILDKWLK